MARIKRLKKRNAYYVPTMRRKDQLIKINLLPRFLAFLFTCIQFSVSGRSPEQIAEWLEESSWSVAAQYNLGIAHMEGDGVPEDFILSKGGVFINDAERSLLAYLRQGNGRVLSQFKDKED